MLLGDIEHVDDNDHRNAHLDQLSRQVKIALEIRRINDVDDCLRLARKNVIASDALIFAGSGRRRD